MESRQILDFVDLKYIINIEIISIRLCKRYLMFKEILQESIQEVADNYILVRIAFVTTFLHTIISLITIANYFTNIFIYKLDMQTTGAWEQVMLIMQEIMNQWYFFEILLMIMLFVIWYFFIYPVGIWIMISYLKHWKVWTALLQGFSLFWPLAVIHAWMAVITISGQTTWMFMRLVAADITDNLLVQIVMVMIWVIILVWTVLLPYSLYVPVMEDLSWSVADQAQQSMKISSWLALKNLWLTIKFTLLSAVLQVRVLINIAILVFIPWILMYFSMQFGLLEVENLNYVLYISGGILLLVIIYVNALIDAFFTTYWYKLYRYLT